jgi:glutamate-ammonia-ligase adenylyltransferase
MTYGSDLDLVFVYEPPQGHGGCSREHFAQAGQEIIRTLGRLTEHGRLYGVDLRLRPTGKSGPLVATLSGYRDYARGDLAFWERMALTRARPLAGDADFGAHVQEFLTHVAYAREDAVGPGALLSPKEAREQVAHLRWRMEQSPSGKTGALGQDLKRGPGGLVDVEFLVQTLQVLHGAAHPALRTPNILAALHALGNDGLLERTRCRKLIDAYRFLRTIESRVRIVHGTSVNRLPVESLDLELLAHRAGYEETGELSAADVLRGEFDHHTRTTREIFAELIGTPALMRGA